MLELFRASCIPSFHVHCVFCIRNFHRLWHWNELVYQVVMRHRSKSFACNVVIMNFGLKRFHSLPCGFMRFHFTTIHCFGILLGSNFRLRSHFRDAIWRSSTRHGWCHKYFQFSPRVFFVNFFVFFVTWIDEVHSSQSSSSVELWFFFCPFSCLSRFWAALPFFVPTCGHTWSGLVVDWIFVSLSPGPHISFWRLVFQWSELSESSPRIWHMSVRIDNPVIVNTFFL